MRIEASEPFPKVPGLGYVSRPVFDLTRTSPRLPTRKEPRMSTITDEPQTEEPITDDDVVQDDEPLEPPEPADPEDGKPELFDKSEYDREDLALPKVDGEGVDKIAIAFSGTVLLDRSDPADVDLIRRFRLGSDVTLNVEASCSAKAHKFTTSREGELDAVVYQVGAKVHTVYRSTETD